MMVKSYVHLSYYLCVAITIINGAADVETVTWQDIHWSIPEKETTDNSLDNGAIFLLCGDLSLKSYFEMLVGRMEDWRIWHVFAKKPEKTRGFVKR